MDHSHGGRVEREGDAQPLADAMGDSLAEAALPGVFASGKTVVASSSGVEPQSGQKFITFRFDDGSDMTIVGTYEVQANQAGINQVGEAGPDLIEHGKELMSGEGLDDSDVS